MTRKATPHDAPRNEAHYSPYSPKEQHQGMATALEMCLDHHGFAFRHLANLATAQLQPTPEVTIEVR